MTRWQYKKKTLIGADVNYFNISFHKGILSNSWERQFIASWKKGYNYKLAIYVFKWKEKYKSAIYVPKIQFIDVILLR